MIFDMMATERKLQCIKQEFNNLIERKYPCIIVLMANLE